MVAVAVAAVMAAAIAMGVPMVVATAAAVDRVALVAGATGLVGREVLAALLADKSYATVHSVGRRALSIQHPKLVQHIADFKALPALPAVDDVFIALGTTIKVAGSQAAFRAVDFEAVVALALAAHAAGATKSGVISAMGADARSAIFYNRVKGEMEEALTKIGFDSLVIARPSMLAGHREALDQPVRKGERIALLLSTLLKPLISANYRSIQARDVALALIKAVKTGPLGVQRLLSGSMHAT